MGAVLIGVDARIPAGVEVLHYLGVDYWAERGLIHSIRAADGKYDSCIVGAFVGRAKALQELLDYSRKTTPNVVMGELYARDQRAVEGMISLCRRAKEQGDPMEPEARAEARRRRPMTMVVSQAPVYKSEGNQL